MFVGREQELKFLQDRYEKEKGQLAVLYSGRRVGKKVSDLTNSTPFTGSSRIIPDGAGVLMLGVAIYIGKRKKEK